MRYVIRQQAQADHTSTDRAQIASLIRRSGARILDDSPGMLLISCTAALSRHLIQALPPGWLLNRERVLPLPPRGPRGPSSGPVHEAPHASPGNTAYAESHR